MSTPLRVAVLAQRSLFTEGIVSRLREHAGQVEVQAIEAGAPGALHQLGASQPDIVVLDATDISTLERLPLVQLWSVLPKAKIMQLDSATEVVRVFCCAQYHAHGIEGLFEILGSVGRAVCLAPAQFKGAA
jgi:hypothetical protein